MGLIQSKEVRAMVAKKLLHPANLGRLFSILTSAKKHRRVDDDAQLRMYSKMVPTEFLHYGYFEEPNVSAERLSFFDIEQAQLKYAELIINCVKDNERPILDGGCGMGGLSRELKNRGLKPVALTPDASQIRHIQKKYPDIELTHSKFEDYDTVANKHRFGTVILSESLQYMDLQTAAQNVKQIMHPGGRWIVTDYFRKGEAHEKSGHNWSYFLEVASQNGFEIVHEKDITENVLPTMAFTHLLAQRLAVPMVEFIFDKMETKTKALYFVLEEVIKDLKSKMGEQLAVIDPEVFARDKRYMLVALELRKN